MWRAVIGAAAVIAYLIGSASGAMAVERPNVVLVLIDNCGQEWFGCYGSDEGRTPQIDRLAREGVRFEHCYTFPICGPSRIELLTGRYPLRTGFIWHHDAGLYSGGGLDPAREVVFARLFRDAGYATGVAGKWQVNNLYDEPSALSAHGFQEHLVWPGSIDRDRMSVADWQRYQAAILARDAEMLTSLNRFIESRYWDPVLLRNGRREVKTGAFGPDEIHDFALDFIERHRAEPFLLYYPMFLTHGQSFAEPVVATPANRQTDRPHHEQFGDMLGYADRLIGELTAKLEQLHLRERTIFIVASDNGTESSLTARRDGQPARGGLYQLTEAGSDVALIVNSPRLIPGGRTIRLADFTDILPTLCDLTGIGLPSGVQLDGHSHRPQLVDRPGAQPAREMILNQLGTRRAVRDARYKLYSTGEMFDVEQDREETSNLTNSTLAEVVTARERLAVYLASLPPDATLPFELRSLAAFKARAEREKSSSK